MERRTGYLSDSREGHTRSVWMDVELPIFPVLEENADADVCIVGAGIAGMSVAYHLAKQGKSVIVVDQGQVGDGQTARTTAHLTWALDERFFELEKLFGKKGAKLALESHAAAIDTIENTIKDENIECDFERVNGYLFLGSNDKVDTLDKELSTIEKLGAKVNKLDTAPAFNSGPCLEFPKQAQFHILKYLEGLTSAFLRHGGRVFGDTHISKFKESAPSHVETADGKIIHAHSIVVATSTPINNRFYIHTKQAPYRTYVIGGTVKKGSIKKGLYWDTEDPYHYIRLQDHLTDPGLEWLIVGGEDHKTGQCDKIEERYQALEKWAKDIFPQLDKIEYHWSGQVFEPIDSLAFIGLNPGNKHVYMATGDSGNGMTHGTIAGLLISDLILEKDNPWRHLYEPSRKTLMAAPRFIEESLNVAWQYRDWFTPGELHSIDTLPSNEGVILRESGKKVAVFKDEQNNVHVSSAVCPHLGACVRWNNSEKTWDCPCHGSQFSGCGKVLNGPSIKDLDKP